MNEARVLAQLSHLRTTHIEYQNEFLKKRPLDRFLSQKFRREKKFGSHDRRFISDTIYSFYRWFGWLTNFGSDDLKLLFAYKLDEGPQDEKIQFWAKSVLKDEAQQFLENRARSLPQKLKFIRNWLPSSDLNNLSPDFFPTLLLSSEEFLQRRAPLWIRVREKELSMAKSFLTKENIPFSNSSKSTGALKILKNINFHSLGLFRNKKAVIQDVCSQRVAIEAAPQQEDYWWDVCAGAGGKSLHLIDLMKNQGKVFCTDIRDNALQEFQKRIPKELKKNFELKSLRSDTLISDKFDGILVDAPCSSSGTYRRNPEIRWQIKKEDLGLFQKKQLEILNSVQLNVRQGGKLIYSTCSLFPEENEEVIEEFLTQHQNYVKIENKTQYLMPPEWDGIIMFVSCLERKF